MKFSIIPKSVINNEDQPLKKSLLQTINTVFVILVLVTSLVILISLMSGSLIYTLMSLYWFAGLPIIESFVDFPTYINLLINIGLILSILFFSFYIKNLNRTLGIVLFSLFVFIIGLWVVMYFIALTRLGG
ncbi:hypothetical protein ACTWQB_00655 [Piscibacillus sp. B03]|uniref:hypothetical protein n=1 Tax=Piscibacillus sp. B03 TaxID=3457430 RepID=UPI003FCC78C4